MTISFQGNQYFHPIYGWIDRYRPDLGRQSTPAIPAGRLLEITQDNVNKVFGTNVSLENAVISISKAAAENQKNSLGVTMPVDYYERNISVHPYKGVQGYQFNYSGNELTIRIADSLARNSPIDIFRDYEQHR